jgi:hypothetical protein
MAVWHATGEIYMESTGTSASYDVEFDDDWDDEPDAMKILYALMNIGDLQIIPEDCEFIPDEFDDQDEVDDDL